MTTRTEQILYRKKQIIADTLTPISVFNRLKGKKKFILESSEGHGEKGRYSFIGSNPFKEITSLDHTTVIYDCESDTDVKLYDPPLEIVKKHIPQQSLNLPFTFYGGAVGYVGYDIIRHYEDIGLILEDDINMPDLHLMFYQDVIIFDHQKQTLTLIALNLSNNRTTEDLAAQVNEMERQLQTDVTDEIEESFQLNFQPLIEQNEFIKMVDTAKHHIINGDIFQVVLSQRMKAQFTVDPFSFYRKLRLANPSPYMFFIDFEKCILLGASPESLIKTRGDEVITNPIAGTRPRGNTKTEDEALAKELLADSKERAEHKMLVDLSRNDLGRVSQVGTVKLSKYMLIERYQHVMHIVSEVKGQLRNHKHGIDALIATLPAGTVSGAPKIRAMEIVNKLEKHKRGVYAGSVGYMNIDGNIDLALAIRTMVIKGQTAYVQAGAGIVYDSVPEDEFNETLNKAKSLLEVSKHDFTH